MASKTGRRAKAKRRSDFCRGSARRLFRTPVRGQHRASRLRDAESLVRWCMFRPETSPDCPVCGSDRIAWIFYGLPVSFEAFGSDLDEQRVILGGCCVSETDPEWKCRSCGHGWGRPKCLDEFHRLMEEAELFRESFWQRAWCPAEADDATAEQGWWERSCGRSFSEVSSPCYRHSVRACSCRPPRRGAPWRISHSSVPGAASSWLSPRMRFPSVPARRGSLCRSPLPQADRTATTPRR